MTRTRAGLSHFLLSLMIVSIVVFTLLFFWYPAPFFTAEGGWQGLKIIAGVDLVLGPLLTLIIFDITKSKAKLMGDLTFIAVLQISALAWGVNTIYSQRPVAVVFWENEFLTVTAKDLGELTTLEQFEGSSPVLIYAKKPRDLAGLKALSKRINEQGKSPHHQVVLYQPLLSYYADIKDFQVDINEIINFSPRMKADLMAILAKSGKEISDYDYFPLRSKYNTVILMFSHDGQLLNHIIVPLD